MRFQKNERIDRIYVEVDVYVDVDVDVDTTENMDPDIDNNFDLFHNNYNYELDEQPLIVQNKSLKYIDMNPNYDLQYWSKYIFPDFNKKPY